MVLILAVPRFQLFQKRPPLQALFGAETRANSVSKSIEVWRSLVSQAEAVAAVGLAACSH